MSTWDDDFDAPRTGPRVVCRTHFSCLGEIAEDGERALAALPKVQQDHASPGERILHQRQREATAALQGLLS